METEETATPQSLPIKEDLSKTKREKKDSKNDDVMVRSLIFNASIVVVTLFKLL